MKSVIIAATTVALAAATASASLYSNAGGYGSNAIGLSTGAITGSGVAAPDGFLWSEAQNDGMGVANTNAGYTATGNFRLADDFTVPAGQSWTVTNILTYGYQTGSVAGAQPITGGTINIWSGGAPNGGGSILASGTFGGSANTNIYRLFSTTLGSNPPGTTRLVREVTWNFTDLVLGPGTYWIDFAYTAVGSVFVPPITVPGTRGLPGWNALQLQTGTWVGVVDTGEPTSGADIPQDLPFVVVPAPSAAALLGLSGLAVARRRR